MKKEELYFLKIIKVNNCGECQYKDTNFDGFDKDGDPIRIKYCRLKYIKRGQITEIENLNEIAEWCDLDDYKE